MNSGVLICGNVNPATETGSTTNGGVVITGVVISGKVNAPTIVGGMPMGGMVNSSKVKAPTSIWGSEKPMPLIEKPWMTMSPVEMYAWCSKPPVWGITPG